MTTIYPPIAKQNSQLFKAGVYESDGVTKITPLSSTCTIFELATGTKVVDEAAGQGGLGYAQYNWAGTSTPGEYEAILTVVVAAGVTKSEFFRVYVNERPMTFTTDPATDLGMIRAELGDDVPGRGVLPDGSNISDGLIQAMVDREGDAMVALASLCEMLSRRWTNVADITLGGRSEKLSGISTAWAARAASLRTQYGYSGGSQTLEAGAITIQAAEDGQNVY
jgi:hypothetical protein